MALMPPLLKKGINNKHFIIIFRSWLAALEVTKAIVIHLERKQLLIATEEVSWLGIPMSSIDGNAGGQAYNFDAISIYPVIRSNSR